MTIRIKNWSKHQHFKDRTPPWIKLYREILDDPDWHELSGDDAKTLVGLWLIASEDESHTGALPSTRKLAFRLRVSEHDLIQSLNRLSQWLISDDIGAISCERQADAPETETETETETDRDIPPAVPAVVPVDPVKPAKPKAKCPPTITDWLASLDGADAIPADDPVYAYAERTGIPEDFLLLSWSAFKDSYGASGKRQKDFPATYRNAVKGNWYKLWWFDAANNGECRLTTAGEQARRAAA